MSTYTPAEIAKFTLLYSKSLVPLKIVLPSLTWVLHDYLITLEDEVRYIWGNNRSLGKSLFLFIRYYTVFLLVFDVVQIHTFAIPGITSNTLCIVMHPITRFLGAVLLWAVEIVMQLRIYALFNRSKFVAVFNGVLFIVSMGAFLWMMVVETKARKEMIASAIHLPLPGCPVINGGSQWALWVPATGFEFVLFMFALYKSARTLTLQVRLRERTTLTEVLLGDNILYFFGVSILLIFNNLMVVGKTKIPWFSFGPFHAALGIMTTRMLMHLVKVATDGPLPSMPYTSSQGKDSYRYPMSAPKYALPTDTLSSTSTAVGVTRSGVSHAASSKSQVGDGGVKIYDEVSHWHGEPSQ